MDLGTSQIGSRLATRIGAQLILRDPFMIASSHWTDNERSFQNLAPFRPSAITLKTISDKKGGGGVDSATIRAFGARDKVELRYPTVGHIGYYVDGPPAVELWDLPTFMTYVDKAAEILPDTKIGMSVLQGEDYIGISSSVQSLIVEERISFAELNWKYTFRDRSILEIGDVISRSTDDVISFIGAFEAVPKIIKVSGEIVGLLADPAFRPLIELLAKNDCALLIANSRRCAVPPSRQGKPSVVRKRGVLTGRQLFFHTFDATYALSQKRQVDGWSLPTLIATGGIEDVGCVIDAIAAGADAVQLCSVLDHKEPLSIGFLRQQLAELVGSNSDLAALKDLMRGNESVWGEFARKAAGLETSRDDVRRSISGNHSKVIQMVGEALHHETLSDKATAQSKTASIEPGNSGAFVINRGSVGACLLGHQAARLYGFDCDVIDDANELRQKLSEREYRYSYAIVPEDIAESLMRVEKIGHPANKPQLIGSIGYSAVEVVGLRSLADTKIRNLYHFNGIGSRRALRRLMPQLNGRYERIFPLENPKRDLPPLLRFWDSRDAILAKAPLTAVYPLLISARTSKPVEWTVHWRDITPLVLLASAGQCESVGGDAINAGILDAIRILSCRANSTTIHAARELAACGYFDHLANLLGAHVLA